MYEYEINKTIEDSQEIIKLKKGIINSICFGLLFFFFCLFIMNQSFIGDFSNFVIVSIFLISLQFVFLFESNFRYYNNKLLKLNTLKKC